MVHAHAVDIRSSFPLPLPPVRRPGDKAKPIKITCYHILIMHFNVNMHAVWIAPTQVH